MMPNYVEKKGSLSLRSDHMDYGRATLISNWHQAREAEPKDYNIHDLDPCQRNLHVSTYMRIGDVTDGSLPSSSSHDHMEQIKLKKDFQEQVVGQPMINMETFDHMNLERHTGAPARGYGSVLPHHPPGHNRRYLNTTYGVDYKAPFPQKDISKKADEKKDLSTAYKKCHSQFTDVDDYRRQGQNTWHEESGLYANTEEKRKVFKPTNSIPERLL